MSVLRFVARSLFATYYITEGVKAVAKPAEIAPDAEHLTSTIAPLVQRVVPADLASYVPEKPETWVRIGGVTQIVGGTMFATGIGRRLGAFALSTIAGLNLLMALPGKGAPPAVKQAARPEVLRHGALLGAALLASLDTQGKPGIAWRAEQAAKTTSKKASTIGDDLSSTAKRAAAKADRKTRKLAKRARRQAKKLGKKLDTVTAR